jgi:energy-coupling factor transport system ATP-binding protein
VWVRDLTIAKGRGRRATTVVHGVDLDVPSGAFLAILGENGAGKTSLLQAIAGVVPPPRGRVLVRGIDPATTDARTLARTVGFVFQNPEHQFIGESVHAELAHGLRLQGVAEPEIEARVDAMLTRFGLQDSRDLHPFLLSGGQKRRLSVGTALISGPPVLALDEPTYGQDRERARELLDLLSRLHEEGTTVLVVTHDLQLAADHATHLAVMREGVLLGVGPTDEVLRSDLVERAGLRRPPVSRVARSLRRHPEWRDLTRLAEVPGATEAVG